MRAITLIVLILLLLGNNAYGIKDGVLSSKKNAPRKMRNKHVGDLDDFHDKTTPFLVSSPARSALIHVSNAVMNVEQRVQECYNSFVVGALQACRTALSRQFWYTILFFEVIEALGIVGHVSPGSIVCMKAFTIKSLLRVRKFGTFVAEILLSPCLLVLAPRVVWLAPFIPNQLLEKCCYEFVLYLWLTIGVAWEESELQDLTTVRLTKISIYEEVMFRCLMNWPLWGSKWFHHLTMEENPTRETLEWTQKNVRLFHRAFVILKGICFGSLHIDPSLGHGFGDLDDDKQLERIVTNILLPMSCYHSSVRYDALAQEHGLMAAIGAHVVGNILMHYGFKAVLGAHVMSNYALA